MKRRTLTALLPLMFAAFPSSVWAQAYPGRTIHLVVSQAAGTGVDSVARTLAEAMAEDLGQAVVVENRPGASGSIAAMHALSQPADGYTLYYSGISSLAWAPLMFPLKFDPIKDFEGVALVADSPYVISTSASSKFSSFEELVRQARQNPGQISYASFGVGNSTHLVTEAIAERAQMRLHHVPYNGTAAVTNTMSGLVDFVTTIPTTVTELVRTGRLRALAVTGHQRVASLPDVPTLKELNLHVEAPGWTSVSVKKGTPRPIIERLNAAINKALDTPRMKEKLASQSLVPLPSKPQDVEQWITRDHDGWAPLIERLNLKP